MSEDLRFTPIINVLFSYHKTGYFKRSPTFFRWGDTVENVKR